MINARSLRRAYRRLFAPEPPPRLDGPFIIASVALGSTWQSALAERERMNRERREAWRRGESLP